MSHHSPAPVAVLHSCIAPTSLLAAIVPAYPLASPLDCRLLLRGVNDTYLLQTTTARYIVRVYHAHRRTLSAILFELDALLYLDRQHISVSIPLARQDGQFVSTLHAPEGLRYVVLFTYAAGTPLNRHAVTDSFAYGKAVAMLHAATEDFTSMHQREPLDLTTLLDHSLQLLSPLTAWYPLDWDYLQAIAARLHTHIQVYAAQDLEWGWCHGDSHLLNTHCDTNGTLTFFDFDCCAMGWRVYDLATVRWSEGFYEMDPDDRLWEAFLAGYREQRPLTPTTLAAIPAFVAVREIWHLALEASLRPLSGFQGFERVIQRTVRLLHLWEARYFPHERA